MKIRHGKVYPMNHKGLSKSHLGSIAEYVTRGVADAKDPLILETKVCDITGAKRHDPERCVVARCVTRTQDVEAVAVSRTMTYVVQGGVAIRHVNPSFERHYIEEWDARGRSHPARVKLLPVNASWRLGNPRGVGTTKNRNRVAVAKRPRTRRLGVRAVGGGVTR